jgi:HEAT repeat protein
MDRQKLQRIKNQLYSENVETIQKALRELSSADYILIPEDIVPLLKSTESEVRAIAIDLLIRIGKKSVPPILELLSDMDENVRKIALDVLKNFSSPEAEEHLIRLLFDDDINVAIGAAETLGKCGTQKSIPYLCQCLDKAPWIKCAAIKSLGQMKDASALDAIVAISLEEEKVVLFSAVQAIQQIGSIKGLDFLIQLLERENGTLLPHIVHALASILKSSDNTTISNIKKKIDPITLINLLEQNNKALVGSTIDLLGFFEEQSAVEKLVKLYTESNEPLFDKLEDALKKIQPQKIEPFIKILNDRKQTENVKISAVRLMGQLTHAEIPEVLLNVLPGFQEDLKVETIKTLGELKSSCALDYFHTNLCSSDEEVQLAIIGALKMIKDTSSIPFLLECKSVLSDQVRSAAARLLSEMEANTFRKEILQFINSDTVNEIIFGIEMISERSVDLFQDKLLSLCIHTNEWVRKNAVEKVSFLKDKPSFDVLSKSINDPDTEVRRSAIRGFMQFQKFDVAPLLLTSAQKDKDQWNQYEAIQVAGQMQLNQLAPELIQMLSKTSKLNIAGILDFLGEIGNIELIDTIKPFLEDEDQQVKEAAREALEQLLK